MSLFKKNGKCLEKPFCHPKIEFSFCILFIFNFFPITNMMHLLCSALFVLPLEWAAFAFASEVLEMLNPTQPIDEITCLLLTLLFTVPVKWKLSIREHIYRIGIIEFPKHSESVLLSMLMPLKWGVGVLEWKDTFYLLLTPTPHCPGLCWCFWLDMYS